MKNFIYAVLLLPNLLFGIDDERLVAKITKVTVFQNQAQITSIAKGIINAGNNTLLIENVSPNLDAQSIQVVGKGDIILLGTKFSNNYVNAQKSSIKMTQLTDSLRLINDYLRLLALTQDSFEREKDLLKANYAIGSPTVANSFDKVKSMADFFRLRMTDINSNLIKNERQISVLKEKITKIQLQMNELNEKKNNPTGEISISVSSKSRTNTELEITYIVHGAGWAPIYEIRVKDTKNPVTLTYKANVWQTSGLDWTDVKLNLSTANPSQGGTKPEIYPQYIDIFVPQPYPSPKRSKAMESRTGEAAPTMDAMVLQEAVNTADFVTVQENTLAVSFDIALPYTILNGGSAQLVDIQSYELPAQFKHFAVPKYDQDAFLTVQITSWEQYNLLPGKANVYFEAAFVGETFVANNEIKDTMNLSVGRDRKINLKREISKDFTSKKTIGSNIREAKAFKITIRNTKKEPVDLVLEDQLPISKNSEIEILETEYKGADLDPETGKLTWRLNLKPNETKIVELKYVVKYPKGKTISGNY